MVKSMNAGKINKTIAIILLIAILGMLTDFILKRAIPETDALQPIAGDIGGPFTLIDMNGHTVSENFLTERFNLIYFGFTYCPVICPTELTKMTAALKQLPDHIAAQIQPIFITVDPDRDTPDVMRGYVDHFHPRLIGLTGSAQQIETVKKAYKVYAAKVDDPTLSDYTVDHSSYIFFTAPDGSVLNIFKTEDDVKTIAGNINAWVAKLSQ